MQFFFDFLPLIVFFVAYKLAGMLWATGAIIVATAATVTYQWLKQRTVNRMQLISAALVVVFGGITLLVRDAIFIQWKPTIVYWLFAAAFLASQIWTSKPIIQRMLEEAVELERQEWGRLNLAWAAFFGAMGVLNLYVVYNFDEPTWVNFKLFGTLGLTIAMVVVQALWLARRMPTKE
jgi:intracellular septation protein